MKKRQKISHFGCFGVGMKKFRRGRIKSEGLYAVCEYKADIVLKK